MDPKSPRSLGLGAAAAILPAAGLRAVPAGAQVINSPADLITRPIPQTNERLPAIGLGGGHLRPAGDRES